jgi:hypothetical protein
MGPSRSFFSREEDEPLELLSARADALGVSSVPKQYANLLDFAAAVTLAWRRAHPPTPVVGRRRPIPRRAQRTPPRPRENVSYRSFPRGQAPVMAPLMQVIPGLECIGMATEGVERIAEFLSPNRWCSFGV